MTNPFIALVCLATTGWAANGIIYPNEIPTDAVTGTLFVDLMTEDRDEVDPSIDSVMITIEDVRGYNAVRGWISLLPAPQQIDLLSVDDDFPTLLAAANVYAGSYDKLRLVVSSPTIVVDGFEQSLRVEGKMGMESEVLDFDQPFFLPRDRSTTLELDRDLDSALRYAGGRWSLGTGFPIDLEIRH